MSARVIGQQFLRSQRPFDLPPEGRMMIFVDGENLVFRFQEMLAAGATAREDVVHEDDVYVWAPHCTHLAKAQSVLRATYYTYAVGDDERIAKLTREISALRFRAARFSGLPDRLTAKVFKKPSQAAKTKGVDISICVDMLSHVFKDNVDAIYLMSGDGDYVPLLEEVLREGKQVYVSAFSSGLNPAIQDVADAFQDLDGSFFENP